MPDRLSYESVVPGAMSGFHRTMEAAVRFATARASAVEARTGKRPTARVYQLDGLARVAAWTVRRDGRVVAARKRRAT